MRTRMTIGLLLVVATAIPALSQEGQLQVSRKPQLVYCDDLPCFRLEVSALDAKGPIILPPETPFKVFLNTQEIPVVLSNPVAGSERQAAASTQTRRITLVVFDTSGSMNQRLPNGETKFAMARRQLELLFATFRDGVDQMAIAPFDSLQVAPRIRDATFETTRAGLRTQVGRLRPTPQGNTALFSAVHEGLQVLQPRTRENAQISMIVFTDGKNDVGHPTDDPGLLDGTAGLNRVRRLAEETGVTIYTVGYGAPGITFDQDAMRALAYPQDNTRYFSASDEARLIKAFEIIDKIGAAAFRLFVGPLPQRIAQLQGQSVVFRVTAGSLTGESPRWNGTPLMPPPTEGTMSQEERIAWLRSLATDQRRVSPPVAPIIMRMIVLVTYALLLAVLWFGLPRLLWPERYIPKPAFHAPAAGGAPRGSGHGATQPRATTYARPEVTISGSRGAPRAHPSPPGRDAGPGRTRQEPPVPAPRSREPLPPREASDATVFIPPPRKPGGDS